MWKGWKGTTKNVTFFFEQIQEVKRHRKITARPLASLLTNCPIKTYNTYSVLLEKSRVNLQFVFSYWLLYMDRNDLQTSVLCRHWMHSRGPAMSYVWTIKMTGEWFREFHIISMTWWWYFVWFLLSGFIQNSKQLVPFLFLLAFRESIKSTIIE